MDGHPVHRLHAVRRPDADPARLIEAASIDGAGPWNRFRYVAFPALKPILPILTALSVLWDFRVFTQIYVLQQAGGITRDTNLLGVYAYRISIGENRFDIGAAIAIVMVAIIVLLTRLPARWLRGAMSCRPGLEADHDARGAEAAARFADQRRRSS